MPLLVASQTVPLVALAPLMILWFGFGLLPKVLLVILVTFFPILVSLLSGYAQVPQAYLDLLTSMGAGRARIFRRATLPVGARAVLRRSEDLGHLCHRRDDLRRICRGAAGARHLHPDGEEQLPGRSRARRRRRLGRPDASAAGRAAPDRTADGARPPERSAMLRVEGLTIRAGARALVPRPFAGDSRRGGSPA